MTRVSGLSRYVGPRRSRSWAGRWISEGRLVKDCTVFDSHPCYEMGRSGRGGRYAVDQVELDGLAAGLLLREGW